MAYSPSSSSSESRQRNLCRCTSRSSNQTELYIFFMSPRAAWTPLLNLRRTARICMGADVKKKMNTSNLWGHLKSRHPLAYHEAIKKKDEMALSVSQPQQPTLVQLFDAKRKWGNNDPRSKKFDKMIVEMIATDNQPFTVVDDIGFRRVLQHAEPRYNFKSEKYYRTTVLEDIYNKVQEHIQELVSSKDKEVEPFLSFTTDCWSGDTESLMSLTCHFINEEWKRQQVVLNVKAMTGSHTGEYISEMFLAMLEQWHIPLERVFLVLRDSGANMVKGLKLAEVPDLSCSAHTLQLVINEGLASQRAIVDIIAKLKHCATHFNHSILAKQRLQKIQSDLGLPLHNILQDVPTRWNSTLHMMQRMLEQKRALNVYGGEYGKFTTLSADQWELVSNTIDTLAPFEEVTLEMSHSESSISCIIPSIAVLKMILRAEGPSTRGIKTLRQTMLQSLERRFAKMEDSKILVLSTLLDPRYKANVLSAATRDPVQMWIQEEHSLLSPKQKRVAAEVEERPRPGLVEQMFANILQATSPDETAQESDISSQLDQYLHEPLIDRKTGNPLEWWQHNAVRFNLLAPIAQKFLSAPPSSVPSERVFSEVGNIYTTKRNRLTGENAERLCFLHYNLPLLKWEY
uniref:HAT C-terminal dimerisation domain-containing protein n=1 Tax=Acanthochromis polyacanthus TaxID=80966 RepID=A0A3Q1EVB9_9TELE